MYKYRADHVSDELTIMCHILWYGDVRWLTRHIQPVGAGAVTFKHFKARGKEMFRTV